MNPAGRAVVSRLKWAWIMVIIVPYRDRQAHLDIFASYFTSALSHQALKLCVIEQGDAERFNRGALINAGFKEVAGTTDWVIFHDVDMIPKAGMIGYEKPAQFCHLSGKVEQFGFRLPYRNYFGGVLACTSAAFERVNGFSNLYQGWGCEDDDLFLRCVIAGVQVERASLAYTSLPHQRISEMTKNNIHFTQEINRVLSGEHLGIPRIDPRLFRRVDPEIFRRKESNSKIKVSNDGLSSLQYTIVSRRPLGSRITTMSASKHYEHEIVTVILRS